MKKTILFAAVAGLAGLAMAQGGGPGYESRWGEADGSAWRLTIGAGVNTGMKADFSLDATRAVAAGGGSVSQSGRSRSAATKDGDSYDLGNGRTSLPNGGYIDSSDSAGVPGETWNWYIPAGAIGPDGKMSTSSPYTTASSQESYSTLGGTEDGAKLGLSLGLDRSLAKSGDFGLDIGLGFNWFQDTSFAKVEGQAWSRTDTKTSGTYVTDVSFNQDLLNDPWTQNPDGSYGAGSYGGPGPVLTLGSDVTTSHHWTGGKSSSKTTTITMRAEGEYQEIELTLALKPYWEPAEAFRLQGILGVAAAHASFDFDIQATGGVTDYFSSEKFSEWDFYGLAGAGVILHAGNVCFGFDALARLFADDIDLDGQDIRGKVERAPVLLRLYVGIEL